MSDPNQPEDKHAGTCLVVNCGQLLTLADPNRPRTGAELHDLGIVINSAFLVENGRIAAVGSYTELRSRVTRA